MGVSFVSTRGGVAPTPFFVAIQTATATDSGLFVPSSFPKPILGIVNEKSSFANVAKTVLEPFLNDSREDPLASAIGEITQEAFNFDVPLKYLAQDTAVLELFHGPTAAFKDVGARFLSACLRRLPNTDARPTRILVATSGDTGGAVASAFHDVSGTEVVILFPKGRVSHRQQKQLTCWGSNVHAFAVQGDFDTCQRIVREGLNDGEWQRSTRLLSANSINVGRLLPQVIYYAKASTEYHQRTGARPGLIVPSGNLGNAVAAVWAKIMGFPIGQIILATNANRAIADYFATGVWKPSPTIATIANAMDVGSPSNFERLVHLYPTVEALRQEVSTIGATDDELRETIRRGRAVWGEIWCPHTAAAVWAREKLGGKHWIVVATAHPAKFESVVEPLIRARVPVPPSLQKILQQPSAFMEIAPSLKALRAALQSTPTHHQDLP